MNPYTRIKAAALLAECEKEISCLIMQEQRLAEDLKAARVTRIKARREDSRIWARLEVIDRRADVLARMAGRRRSIRWMRIAARLSRFIWGA